MVRQKDTVPFQHQKNLPESWLTKNGGGTFRGSTDVKKLFGLASLEDRGGKIHFCNTGHWASLGWFADSEILGNKEAKLYDGSMVEWTANKSLPMEKKVDF